MAMQWKRNTRIGKKIRMRDGSVGRITRARIGTRVKKKLKDPRTTVYTVTFSKTQSSLAPRDLESHLMKKLRDGSYRELGSL